MNRSPNASKRVRMEDSEKDANVSVMFPEEFEQILKERRAVRMHMAEQTRLEGLRQIRERNSKTGVDPLAHFPREMWIKILEKLDPKDKASLIEVHPLFLNLMKPHQVGDIYFPLLLDRETGFIKKYFHYPDKNSDLFELRCVSRCIQQAIDKWFEDDLQRFWRSPSEDRWRRFKCLPNFDTIPFRIFMNIYGIDDLKNILEIQKPMKIFQRQCRVLVWGPLRSAADDEEFEQLRHSFSMFRNRMTKAFEQVGEQIWHFQFYSEHIENFGVTRTQVCELLHEWLQHLPNLRFLDIYHNGNIFDGDGHGPIDKSLLEEVSFESSFPTFHALERFDFRSGEDYDLSLICESVIRANPHIKIFNYSRVHAEYRDYLSKPCVQALELELCQTGFAEFPEEWPDFQEITPIILQSSWKLKVLDLCFYANETTVDSIIKFLNRLPTLEHVVLQIDEIAFSSEDVDFLRLPNLRHFGIEFQEIIPKPKQKYQRNIHFFFCLQFLIYSDQLRSFKWSSLSREALDYLALVYFNGPPEGMVDFCGGCCNLNKTNLWDAFPMLDEVKVKSISSLKPTRLTRSNRILGG